MIDPLEINGQQDARSPCHYPPFLARDLVPEVRTRLAAKFPEIISPTNQKPLVSEAAFLELTQGLPNEENPLREFKSLFSLPDKQAILETHFSHWEAREAWRKHYQQQRKVKPLTPEDVKTPQWATIAPARPVVFRFEKTDTTGIRAKTAQLQEQGIKHETISEGGITTIRVFGHRVMLAFPKTMCPFQCTYCTLPGANDGTRDYERPGEEPGKGQRVRPITPENQFHAFLKALDATKSDEIHPPVIEILNDGSWYSDQEISPETRERIVTDVANRPYVQCLAVESRPDYLDAKGIQKIKEDLARLGPNQQLKIYIGLETTDDFVASIARKWYGWAEFETAVEAIAQLPPEDRNRISIVSYNIMKQWCMTDRDALEESVHLVQKIDALSKRTGISIEVKHEPTIVSKGSDQHYFFHQITPEGGRMYQNLSYFTVAELIARLHLKGLTHRIAFGQRDDIDEIETIAMVPRLNNHLLRSPLDFLVYDAVQRFQVDGNIRAFFVNIYRALKNPSNHFTAEFFNWEEEVYGTEGSALGKLIGYLSLSSLTEKEKNQIDLQQHLCDFGKRLEKNMPLQHLSSEDNTVGLREAIQQRFEAHASEKGYEFFKVNNVISVDITKDDVGPPAVDQVSPGYQVEVIIRREGIPSSLWLFIPKRGIEKFEV